MTDMQIYWEDIEVGKTVSFGRKTISKEEMIAFASEFDPQPHHVDEEAAKKTVFEGLSASGWHSAVILMRLVCDSFLCNSSSMGSPGITESKWLTVVRPGDELSGRFTCRSKRVSTKRPELGICDIFFELINQNNQVVMNWDCISFFGRRNPEIPSDSSLQGLVKRISMPVIERIPGNHLVKFFDDIEIGDQLELGSYEFTRDKILDFALTFDPQPFHIDETAARRSHFGGLCASGWHTAAAWMRKMAKYYDRSAQTLKALGRPVPRLGPSLGFKDLRWLKPVYAGDTITYRSWAQRKKDLHANAEWGLLMIGSEGFNQRNELVFSFFTQVYVEKSNANNIRQPGWAPSSPDRERLTKRGRD